ncbi:MAG: PAS domain S-box protein [Burkholderiaceae bacterium]|nr:PAS domain S-box protein [Burkholderiaceae bacterium]MCD6674043.1 PAS domain-containing protein [Burkholderiaceae bacterium]
MDTAALLEQLPDAVIACDRRGLIRVWNAAAARLFGPAASEAIGQSLDIIIPERLREAHWRGFEAAMAAGATKHSGRPLTTRAVSKSGEKLYVSMSFGMLHDADGQVCGAVAVAREAERP